MISKKSKTYCCEDLSLIENYDKAINDKKQMWQCHHRLEIDLNVSANELRKRNLFYNRPASELIYLTRHEHQSLHKAQNRNPFYKCRHTEEKRKELSDINIGAKWMNNGIKRHYVLKDKIEYYSERGYVFGFKLKDL